MLNILVNCTALPAGNNTKSLVDNMAGSTAGTNYTYECLYGYNASSGGLFTECLPSGEWSLSAPTCERSK